VPDPADRFLAPRLEVETAFVHGRKPEGLEHTDLDVMARPNSSSRRSRSRLPNRVPRAITDTIADNAASGGMVVGGRTIRPMDVDIRWVGATLSKNGIIEESGVSAAIMGHPAAGIAWL